MKSLPKRSLLVVVLLAMGSPVFGDSMTQDGVDFFETKIRPVLVEKCYRCHSAEADDAGKLKGDLLLDDRDGLLLGGASGPAVVPGEVDESLLIDALRYDLLQMPPEGKLPDSVIEDFETWVGQGAPDPRDRGGERARTAEIDLEAGREHWAYQAPQRTPAPRVIDASWPRSEIDRFILARLEAEGIRPVADADRTALIRRLSYDLIGLPPTPEEIERFADDPSPTAYDELVDRLLASPHFGERWGRHWLDVARFGESLTLRGLVFKEAWRYRDYVIDAFNADMPFDQFVREQLAGDLLEAETLEDRRRQLVATTFLVLGNTNLEEQDKEQLCMDLVDEQIETTSKAFLAQTVSCARCHDHKFDPIPTSDYYALAGIFRNARAMDHANVSAWIEVPLPMEPAREEAIRAHDASVAEVEAQIKALRRSLKDSGAGDRILAVDAVPGIVVDDGEADRVGDWKHSTYSGTFIGAGYLHDDNREKGEKTLTFQPELPEAGMYEVWLAYSPGAGRSPAVPVRILSAEGDSEHAVDQRRAPPIQGRYVSLGAFRFEANGQAYVQLSNESTQGHVTADAVVWRPVDGTAPPPDTHSSGRSELARLESRLKDLKREAPRREMVMSVVEDEPIRDLSIHIRGSVHNLGEEVPRGFLRVATQETWEPLPEDESGRRQLADWVASEQNPLTARVVVNRAWHWLTGAGLVASVDNFGTTGEAPSHPELLDTMAVQFMEDGWSIKSLVRRIVMSRAYRLSTFAETGAEVLDPENRLRWRMNRRRLEAEHLRDTMLSVSGMLDRAMYGPSFPETLAADYGFESRSSRRSVYEPVFRNALPEIFEVFDFADPSMVVGRRDSSTVATQALFLMNHPFVIEQARGTATRLLAHEFATLDDRINHAYRLMLGRSPSPNELAIARGFLAESTLDEREAWSLFVHTLFATVDFRYAD
ncbi:DUF1553 domain-containing protein [Tautonia sp. JC769]|uniref:DUF1553 domain-containing protein n=1 Tax=Tautonia sp. JC769 TaxID=3232135 RepID=UPI003459536F